MWKCFRFQNFLEIIFATEFLSFSNYKTLRVKNQIFTGAMVGVFDCALNEHFYSCVFLAMFGVFGFALGTASGGFITKRFKLNGRRAATYVFAVSSLNLFIFFLKTFIGCNSVVNTVGILGRRVLFLI